MKLSDLVKAMVIIDDLYDEEVSKEVIRKAPTSKLIGSMVAILVPAILMSRQDEDEDPQILKEHYPGLRAIMAISKELNHRLPPLGEEGERH